MTTTGRDNCKSYGNNLNSTMMQSMVDKTVSAKIESVDFVIRLWQTLDDIMLSPQNHMEVTQAILVTVEFLASEAHVVKNEAD